MTIYDTSRKHMVDSQILTNGVTNSAIVDAFSTVPRELFVADELKPMAYTDEDLDLRNGEFLIEPMVLAKMMQESGIGPDDIVLSVGDSCGYATAILSGLASTVVAVESQPGLFDKARTVWNDQGLCNIAVVGCGSEGGAREYGPYSVVFIAGAVAKVPELLLEQLSGHGRLVAVVRPNPRAQGHAAIVERSGESFSTRNAFGASTPYIGRYAPKEEFAF